MGTYGGYHGVDHGAQHSVDEDTKQCAHQRNADGGRTQAVDDKHDFAGEFDAVDGILDSRWPFQIRQVDAGLQLVLDDEGGVEVEHGGFVGAVGDVFGDADGEVGDGAGGVVALAVVEDVGGVEVFDVEVFGDVADDFVDAAFDGAFDAVEDLGGGFGGVEGCLAEHACV